MSTVDQQGATAENIAGRDQHFYYAAPRTPMATLLDEYRRELESDTEFKGTVEALERYLRTDDENELVGLEEKLRAGGREDLYDFAVEAKEAIGAQIEKHTFSRAAQKIFALLLGRARSRFKQVIAPAIGRETPHGEIDVLLADEVTEKIFDSLCENDLGLDHTQVAGLIYYLTGKCHIRWTA